MKGKLYLCASPIGNLEDVSYRLIRILSEVDVIAAEDTRRTKKLLTHHGVRSSLVSYHEVNERQATPKILARLLSGKSVALISDSGMPVISDPGYPLVQACLDAGVDIEVIPGPSAVLTALVISGLATARFSFEGFLSRKQGERQRRIQSLARDDRTLIFFEAANRVEATLRDLLAELGDRRGAVARELTKVHEEVIRGSLSFLISQVEAGELKGEVTLVVEGWSGDPGDLEEAVAYARAAISSGETKSKAAAQSAARFGVSRREVYDRLIKT